MSEADEPFFKATDVLDHTRACKLFPPELDFSKACSCVDCVPKIAKLKASEKEIKAKKDLIEEHNVQVHDKELLCSVICSSAWWTKKMLAFFHKKLKALDKSESGVSLRLEKSRSAENLEYMVLEILQLMIKSGLLAKPAEKVDDDDYDVLDETERGRFYYGKTKAKNTAFDLLQEIEKNEKDYRENTMQDLSNSKKHIEKQIELVKKLPVHRMRGELVELIEEVKSKENDWKMFEQARGFIYRICFDVITQRNAFWKGVAMFENEWEVVYATFFTPHDRSNPKRLRT